MPKSIKKDLSKVNKLIHPKSRKAQKLHEKANRLETREKSKKVHKMRENLVGEKILWFKERLLPDVKVYTSSLVLDIVEQYLARFDEELEQISIQHSIGHRKRRFASREDIINLTIAHDKEEFETCGLEIPDLMNPKHLAYLRDWNGELRYLQNICLKRLTRRSLLEKISNTSTKEMKSLPTDQESKDKDEKCKSCDDGKMEKDEGNSDVLFKASDDKMLESTSTEDKNDSLAMDTQ